MIRGKYVYYNNKLQKKIKIFVFISKYNGMEYKGNNNNHYI